jgi:hypothetical protein
MRAEIKESANDLVIYTNSLSVESKCSILRLLTLLCSLDFKAPCWIRSCSVFCGGRRKTWGDNTACVASEVSGLDRMEVVSGKSSGSVSYLNFGSAVIFLVMNAMVVSVRSNFGATP